MSFILTQSRRHFDFLNIQQEDIRIEDIANALSMLCRFTGHTKQFYCPTPEQRILTADLQWIPAGDLSVGTDIVGFDEFPWEKGGAGKNRRRFRPSKVLAVLPVKRNIIRLEMEDGSSVRSSEEHPWLVATKQSRNQKWVTAAKIKSDIEGGNWRYRKRGSGNASGRYMHKFIDPWSILDTHDSGWLAGIYDGEGYASFLGKKGCQSGIAQNPGIVLDRINSLLKKFGFDSRTYSPTGKRVQAIEINGGFRKILQFLGSIRPIRLLDKFIQGLLSGNFNKQMDGKQFPLRIVRAYHEGLDWVTGIETTTHTYLCEGYAAHNSVGQHSVLVSRLVPPEYALWGLLHDATEAYLNDISSPLKKIINGRYCELENLIMKAVCGRFGLSEEEPQIVKDVDRALTWTELLQLVDPDFPWWEEYGGKILDVKIEPWFNGNAKFRFLYRFDELRKGSVGER